MKRERDLVWEAAVEECYPSGVVTSMRTEVNGLVRDLKDLKVTPAEVCRRAGLYRTYCEKHDLMFGLRGLVRRWDQFPPPRKRCTEHDTHVDSECWMDENGLLWGRNKPGVPR